MALTIETESRIYHSLRAVFGATAHLVSIGFTVFVAVLTRPGSNKYFLFMYIFILPYTWRSPAGLFSWHPLLMSLAFSFLLTEALLVFSPESSLLRSFSRKTKVRFHWALQVLALICAILGLVIISYNKYLNGKDHFVTWHGLTGLLTVVYATMQCMGGLALLYPKLMKNWTLSKLKLYHATSGLIGYILGCSSLMLGMCSLWFTTLVTGVSWYLSVLCPILTSLVIMNQVSNAYLYRKRIQP